MSGDLEISGTVRSAAFAHLLNLDKFEMYFVLRLLQRLFWIIHPIHAKCQSRHAATSELNMWIQELASALSLEHMTLGRDFFRKQTTSSFFKNRFAFNSSSLSRCY